MHAGVVHDHATAPARHKMPQSFTRAKECAAQVYAHDPVEIGHFHFVTGRLNLNPSVVN